MKSSVPYKTINIVASLACVASIGAMEQELVSSKDMKDFSQSIMMAKGEVEPSLKGSQGSRGWFAGVSDWLFGLDTNIVSELKKGTLTKDVVAQSKEMQKDVYDAISPAIENKRTKNLCVLLNYLSEYGMLNSVAEKNESIAQFLNTEITSVCEQKATAELMDMLNIMKTMQLNVDIALLSTINGVLNEQKERDIQEFRKIYQETQGFVAVILERLEKDKDNIAQTQSFVGIMLECLEKKNKEQYKAPLVEAKNILLIQKYLIGEDTEIGPEKIKEELGLTNDNKKLNTLVIDLKKFVDKK